MRTLIHHSCNAQQSEFIKGAADELHADGEARRSGTVAAGEASGNGETREASEIDADGVDIFEVEGEGIS